MTTPDSKTSSVLFASLVLPGLAALCSALPQSAQAESAPEETTIGFKYGSYQDGQPGFKRIAVQAPQVYLLAPVAKDWSIEASAVADSVSGASPRMHTQQSGASRMSDYRKAGDVKVTRYMARSAYSVGLAYSTEHDYVSKALSLAGRWASDDNNRTWTAGVAYTADRIDNSANGVNTAIDQHKRTQEAMVGVTQVLTPQDIAQINLTRSQGVGYFNDPYKSFDQRPGQRNAWIALARWNHHVSRYDASLRTSYRYYTDTFGVASHTLGADWVQPLGPFTLTPGVRYYTQTAAGFYFDPVNNAQGQYDTYGTIMRAAAITGNKSADQRLSAYGAVTLSLKAAYAVTPRTTVDAKVETYRQTAALRLGGGSPGLDPFMARFWQLGVSHRF
jgi:Protein of unknown function (DUF3570)